jgi:hypothetical protein
VHLSYELRAIGLRCALRIFLCEPVFPVVTVGRSLVLHLWNRNAAAHLATLRKINFAFCPKLLEILPNGGFPLVADLDLKDLWSGFSRGEAVARDRLLSLYYDEFRRIARGVFERRQGPDAPATHRSGA